jgi:hypothetical protein
MRGILAFAPLDLVYLFLNFEGFEVIEFGLVRLEFGMEFVLACLFLFYNISSILYTQSWPIFASLG